MTPPLDLHNDDGAWQQSRIIGASAPGRYAYTDARTTTIIYPEHEDERGRRSVAWGEFDLRSAFFFALEKDRDLVPFFLARAGATEEQLVFASLVISAIIENQFLYDYYHFPYISEEQERINYEADAFLLEYPDTPYGMFVRRYIRKRYRRSSTAIGVSFGLGDSSVGGDYGSLFDGGGMLGFNADFRNKAYHIGFTVLVISSGVRNRADIGDQAIEQNEGYGTNYVGLDVGPRVLIGPLDLQPYVSAGLVDVSPLKNPDGEVSHGSTWDPGWKFGYSYGLKVGIPVLSGQLTRLAVRARAGWIAPNLGTIDGVGLGGQVAFFTLGGSILFRGYERVE